jgi:hypothetical protein
MGCQAVEDKAGFRLSEVLEDEGEAEKTAEVEVWVGKAVSAQAGG